MSFANLVPPVHRIQKIAFFSGAVILIAFLIGCAGSKKKAAEETPESQIFEQPALPIERPPEPVEKAAVETGKAAKIPLIFETVYFDYDKSDVRGDAARTLQQNAKVLKEYPEVKITIEGHCDERGTVEYNLALGDRRAISVKQYLVDLGVSPNRITTISYGKERPADLQKSESAFAKNRRAEFVIR